MSWVDIVNSRPSPYAGLFVGHAVRRLADTLVPPGGIESFLTWKEEAMSVLTRDAIKELALQPAGVGLAPHEIAVQYGMTLGLQLAAAILDDPTIVVSAPVVARGFPKPTYGTGESWEGMEPAQDTSLPRRN